MLEGSKGTVDEEAKGGLAKEAATFRDHDFSQQESQVMGQSAGLWDSKKRWFWLCDLGFISYSEGARSAFTVKKIHIFRDWGLPFYFRRTKLS